MFIAFVLSAVLPLLAASIVYFIVFYRMGLDVSWEIITDRTNTASLLLSVKREAFSRRLEAISSENIVTINLELGLSRAVSGYLEQALVLYQMDSITVWDENGSMFSSVSLPGNVLPLPVYPEYAAENADASTDVEKTSTGDLYLVNSRIIRSGSGKRLGVINARLGISSLCRLISEEMAAPVLFLDSTGRMVSQAGFPAALEFFTDREIQKERTARFAVEGRISGELYLCDFISVRNQDEAIIGWIGSSFHAGSLNGPRNRGAVYLSLILVVILAVCLLVSLGFSKLITRPVRALAGAARKMAEGTYGLTAAIDRNDEIGDLARDFNSLSRSLQVQMTELESTRNYLDNVVNSLPSGLVTVNRQGEITDWNAAAEQLIGMKRSEVFGRKIWDIMPFLHNAKPFLEDVVKNRRSRSLSRENIQPATGDRSSARYIDVSLFPLVRNGITGAVYRFDDVTELERKENQLRQAQKMEMLGNLTSGIAHDFNNILMGIMGTSSLLSLKLSDSPPPGFDEIKKDINSIVKTSERARDLVKQLLSLSRHQEVSLKKINLAEILDSVFKICETSFDRSIVVRASFPKEEAVTAADPVLIEQVVLNICVNAAHAMTIMRPSGSPQGGVLDISLERITADSHFCANHPFCIEGSYWLIRINDNGVGIPPDVMPKIFDPFYTTKTPGQGSGIGLSTAYSIVRHHEGFIDVFSTPGIGTQFCVYLPDRTGTIVDNDKESELPEIYTGRGKILILDDEESVRQVTAAMLSRCGYDPVEVETPFEAAGILENPENEIDLLVLDMSMPDMSGEEAFKFLRARAPGIKVLVASGYRSDPRINTLFTEGAMGFIQKPYSIYDLSKRVHELLNENVIQEGT